MLIQKERTILPETIEDNFDFADVRIFGQWLYLHDIYQEVIMIWKPLQFVVQPVLQVNITTCISITS